MSGDAPYGYKIDGTPKKRPGRLKGSPIVVKTTTPNRNSVYLPEKGTHRISPEQKRIFWERRDAGYSVRQASMASNMAYSTGLQLDHSEAVFHNATEARNEQQLSLPKPSHKLSAEAKRALTDFAYFQRRYFGRIATPWQEMAAEVAIKLLESPEEEYLVVNCPPGCLAGDTRVTINRGGNGRTLTIEELVFKFNGGMRGRGMKKWDPGIPTKIQRAEAAQYKTDTLNVRLGLISDAYYSGEKELFRLRTRGGRVIKATADHAFALDGGAMVPLSDLRPGDGVLVNGGKGGRAEGAKQWYDTTQGLVNHPHRGAWPYRQPNHRLAVEADRNGLPLDWYVAILRDQEAATGDLQFLDPVDAVHHLDGNTRNNVLANLEVKRHTDHWRDHGLDGGWVHVASHIELDIIESIESVGIGATYDITVEDAPHNFIANEFVVHNSGKSTLFTLDLMAWITCRNRSVRGLIGSRTAKQATWYTARLRRALERTIPEKAEAMELVKGRALDAEATLAEDYGRFKPLDRDLWTGEQFIVMQESGIAISEKEATWSAFGMDSGFLGGRYDIVVWDDVVDPTKTKTLEQIEYQREWWNDYAETRLEPGGLLILQGQRIGSDDLYRYCLDMRVPQYLSEDDDEEDTEAGEIKKYKHVVFKAHYEEKCEGDHKLSSPPYPVGCLLYPRRLSWKKLATIMENRAERFRVLYQQEDLDPSEVLIHPDWVFGKVPFPGCVDRDRSVRELPPHASQMLSVVSCDPSPTNNWAIEWWLYHEPSERRYLIDLYRGKLDAPQFLDYDYAKGSFTGVMEDWQETSVRLGVPITHWIVEINAAQRFLLQYDHVQRWQRKWMTQVVPHSTGRNKSDAEYGVETIAPHYEFGRISLPYRNGWDVRTSHYLIDEATHYSKRGGPSFRTDDCVMAQWFFEWQLPNLKRPQGKVVKTWRPSWV